MMPCLTESQNGTNGCTDVNNSTSVRRMALSSDEHQQEIFDCNLEENEGDNDKSVEPLLTKRRVAIPQSTNCPELSPPISTASLETYSMIDGIAAKGSSSAWSSFCAGLDKMMTSDDSEVSSSLLAKYSSRGSNEKSPRKNPKCHLRRKKSLCADYAWRIVDTYSFLVTFCMALFALGFLIGQRYNEHPSSSYQYAPMQSVVHASVDKTARNTTIPQILVGTWYYPWYGGDFHRGDGYARRLLHQRPTLGEYDDRDPDTISQHLQWSGQGNIGLWVTSWWGPYTRGDNTTRTVILQHQELQKGQPFEGHKIALFYESFGRIREEEKYSLDHIRPDMEFICKHYLEHPNYYTLDGRPVMFMYLSRLLETLVYRFESIILMIRTTIKNTCGKDIYIIGDQVFGRLKDEVSSKQRHITKEDRNDKKYSSNPTAFDLFDGVTCYDIYGSMGKVVGSSGGYQTESSVHKYYMKEQQKWRQFVKDQVGRAFIPSVAPGYNDLGVRPGKKNPPLSRSLKDDQNDGNNEGSFFRVSLENARTLVDPSASYLLMVNSFNEWHEDTQIEPASGASTSKPFNLTNGIEYHGYGTLYLDILRNATKGFEIPEGTS